MWAILSDIHGNLEALQAVLQDIETYPVERVYCLGDTVGHGPNQLDCVLQSEWFYLSMMGDCEEVFLVPSPYFSKSLGASIDWFRATVTSSSREVSDRVSSFMRELPKTYQEHNVLMLHGTPMHPVSGYVFPENVETEDMNQVFSGVDKWCFGGHTHVPGIFLEEQKKWSFIHPNDWRNESGTTGRNKVICNVGSVGLPGDGDCRASYVLFDGEAIQFRRVEYDVEATVRKIQEIPELDDFFCTRLREACL